MFLSRFESLERFLSDIVGFVNSDYFYRVNLSLFTQCFLLFAPFARFIPSKNRWCFEQAFRKSKG